MSARITRTARCSRCAISSRSGIAGSGSTCTPSVTAYWLRQGIEWAAESLDVELFISAIDLPAHGADPATLAQHDAFLAECEAFGARAVMVHSDEHAARLIERAMEAGVRIPDDLAVVAYNDETAALAVVPLTAVSPPKLPLGETACELLLRKLNSDPAPIQHLSLLPELRIRSSSGTRRLRLTRALGHARFRGTLISCVPTLIEFDHSSG